MKFTESMYFNKSKYREKISDRHSYSDEKLANEIYSKRAKRLSAKVRVGVGAAAATVTGGSTLVAAAFSGRNVSVEGQKLKLLEEEWQNRGYEQLQKRKFKDKIVPMVITAATSGFAAGMDAVFAVASPDQFAQIIPGSSALNDALIQNVYYGGLEKGASVAGNAVIGKVVSANPKDFRNNKSTSDNEDGYGNEEEDEEEDEDYGDSDYDDDEDEEEYYDNEEDEEDERDDEDEKKYRW